MLESQRAALEIRARLHNPPNARHDPGIDLKNPRKYRETPHLKRWLPEALVPPPVQLQIPEDAAKAEVAAELKAIDKEIAALQARADALRARFGIVKDSGVSINLIQRVVQRRFSLTRAKFLTRRNLQTVVLPRQIAMWLCCEHTEASLGQIGQQFGGRDHTTVISARKKIRRLLPVDPDLRELVAELSTEISKFGGNQEQTDAQPETPA